MNEPHGARPGRRRLGLAAIAAGAAIALAVVVGQPAAEPANPSPSPGTGSASCVESYSLATLANRSFAFDGTVTVIDGDSVTFTVNEAYRGVSGDAVTLQAPGMTGTTITSAGGPVLVSGERYLVAGDATFAWACGFTQRWDAAVAAEWSGALGS
ncbi:MAG: hypothetical protein A2V85_10730 [Chloroflexi bacterium RBG_16_72_14]|nr:MAG: hypothetical protein A2V85_10730 [Chloroflexi bacterium RBG_16_72_14]